MKKMIKIYVLRDPTTHVIRYVGKTVKKLSYRLSGHICEARKRENKTYRNSWIQSLLSKQLYPEIKLIVEIDYTEDWEKIEQYWIALIKKRGFPLTNLTNGGDGNKGQYRSKESIEKFKKTIARKIKSGEISYKERAKKISKAHMNKIVSLQTRNKLRLINLGKKASLESKIKQSKGGVFQYDLNNNFITKYFSLSEAVKATGFWKGNISSACTGRLKTYKGYIWKYKNKDIVDTL